MRSILSAVFLIFALGTQTCGTSQESSHQHPQSPTGASSDDKRSFDYSRDLVAQLVEKAQHEGNAHRGMFVFADEKSACLSCHRIGKNGGGVGPDLTEISKQRSPAELVESILWPSRDVRSEYVAYQVIDRSGQAHQGYVVRRTKRELVLRDPTKDDVAELRIQLDEVDVEREVGTLMPDNLAARLTEAQLLDLLQFMFTIGKVDGLDLEQIHAAAATAHAHVHPAKFPLDKKPRDPLAWPNSSHSVNRDRVYEFYSKQADHFRAQSEIPPLLSEFPGMDGGELGHWGNQDDTVWRDDRWNQTQLGSLVSGVFRTGDITVPRAVCVRLGEAAGTSVCFNPDTLTYDAIWHGEFVQTSAFRHGFIHGLRVNGKVVRASTSETPGKPFKYKGFYRVGPKVVFSYEKNGREFLDQPAVIDGVFQSVVTEADKHPLRKSILNPPRQWPIELETSIEFGGDRTYSIDSIELPVKNPWNALVFCGGHAFHSDGSAFICTMQGDVWRVSGFEHPSRNARWRRFASGLHQALGIVVDDDGIFVLGRDQITRLHDLNNDGEADFYECFSNAYETSPGGHDYICGLERDAGGNFYFASSNQGLVKVSPGGLHATVLATGFRNPDGIGVLPDGSITIPSSEGEWTPASMISLVKPGEKKLPHFGYLGPQEGRAPTLPLAYLPRGLDNSSGGQVFVRQTDWGPLSNQLLHFSFGTCTHFLVLRDPLSASSTTADRTQSNIRAAAQGAVVPLSGEFRSGVHRGRFNPKDGQLYVSGMQGWASYAVDDGCFQRIRYTGRTAQLPTGFKVHENGIVIKFSSLLDSSVVSSHENHFAQCWNYRYSSGYGSPEFSARHPGVPGHDVVKIGSAHVLEDGKSMFLELPDIQPVNQLHLRVQSAKQQFHDLFATIHQLGKPFTRFPNHVAKNKLVRPHPIFADMAMITRSIPNPHAKKLEGAREIKIATSANLSYSARTIRVRAGEPIALTLSNPDVVPHNWALVTQGALDRVGAMADQFISDPDAALRHYVPESDDVLVYTDVVIPGAEFTVYFHAPKNKGRFPFLCTFPGHWKIMNGAMIVE